VTLGVLGVGYVGVGALLALIAALAGRRPSAADAVLLVGLWPLWAPLALARSGTSDDRHE
jgi:hypothetical protein